MDGFFPALPVSMEIKQRQCPECEHGRLVVSELNRGSRCSYCHRLIETDFVYAAGIPVLLGITVGFAFSAGVNTVGWILTGVIVLYASAFDSYVARYLPLKHYGDSD